MIDAEILRHIDNGEAESEHVFSALVDSGASHTNISQNIIDALGLIPVGVEKRRTPTGVDNADVFEVWIKLSTPKGNVLVFITAQKYDSSGAEHDILLGRDVICLGDFHMLGNGTFELAFPDDGQGNRRIAS